MPTLSWSLSTMVNPVGYFCDLSGCRGWGKLGTKVQIELQGRNFGGDVADLIYAEKNPLTLTVTIFSYL